jgi:hypothetical protein
MESETALHVPAHLSCQSEIGCGITPFFYKIDIVHPPAIAIPPIADIELHQTIVTAALAANSNAATARIARSELLEVASVIFRY